MYYPSSKSKGADQLRSCYISDLHLCFCVDRNLISHDVACIILCMFTFVESTSCYRLNMKYQIEPVPEKTNNLGFDQSDTNQPVQL